MQRQIVKDLLREKMNREYKVKKLNDKLQQRLGKSGPIYGFRDLETLQAIN